MDWLTNELPIARKDHACTACAAWNLSGYTLDDCETPQQREIVKVAKADGWKIHKGQKHQKCTGVDGGEFFTVRARLDMDEVCRALGLYDDV